MAERLCRCGHSFQINDQERRKRKWCSGACRARFARLDSPAYVEAQKARHFPRRPIDYATCSYCSTLFIVRRRVRPTDRVCRSRECQSIHKNHRWRELCRTRKAAGLSRRTPATMERRRADNHERRAKIRGVAAERFSSAEIFERDRWRCGMCGKKVGKKPWPHPLSATLDHVVPLAAGGEHTKANSRCAHLGCNSARRDRGGGEQLRLIG